MKCCVADFYYGAVLSMLLNKGMAPLLIGATNNRRIYSLKKGNKKYIAIMKYCSNNRTVKSIGVTHWGFDLKNDIQVIKRYRDKNKKVVMYLVCAKKDLKDSEIVKVDTNNVDDIIKNNKTSITIGIDANNLNYRVYNCGSAQKDILIKRSFI